MSHPPHGYPPPYGYPPPPPPPAGFAYMPAPVIMPTPVMMYPQPPPPVQTAPEPAQQPTYVTNYYIPQPEQPQPQPAPPPPAPPVLYEEPIDWVPATPQTSASLSHRAFIAGKEGWDGSPLWIIRAHHSGEFVPGKLAIKHRSAYIPHAGREIPVHNYEILCCPSKVVQWVKSSHGNVPPGAIAAGNTHNAEPLYIARVNHLRSVTPGKVHPSHGCAYISFGGKEIAFKNYEVLCKIVG